MKFELILLKNGKKAKIYTILFNNQDLTEYFHFVAEHKDKYSETLLELEVKLNNMVKTHGLQDHFFIRESPESHNVFRVSNTGDLRIFCIRFSNVAIILGNGGIKLPDTVKLDSNPHLREIRDQLMKIEDSITSGIKAKEIIISDTEIKGDLFFEYGGEQ